MFFKPVSKFIDRCDSGVLWLKLTLVVFKIIEKSCKHESLAVNNNNNSLFQINWSIEWLESVDYYKSD